MPYHRKRKNSKGNYDQNDGVPGVVYILTNEAFKDNWLKIGCTRHSGKVRADDMNFQASTGLPAHHVCVFEAKTLDCGRAEKKVHSILSKHRTGRQEFFVVDIATAKATINQVCAEIDDGVRAESSARAEREKISLEAQRRDAELEAARLRRAALAERERLNAAARAHTERNDVRADAVVEPAVARQFAIQAAIEAPPQKQKANNWTFAFVLVIAFLVLAAIFGDKSDRGQKPTLAAMPPAENHAQQEPSDPEASRRQLHFEEIYRSHPDAFEVVGSDGFKAWLNRSGNDVWVETTKTGTAQQVIAMLDSFKADQKTLPSLANKMPNKETPHPTKVQRPPSTKISLKDFRMRTDVRAALQRSYTDYPYLQTEDGREAVRLIMLRAIDLVHSNGYHPVDAVEHSVNSIAAIHEPAWYKPGQDIGESNASGEAGKPARPCRLVTASPMHFQCD